MIRRVVVRLAAAGAFLISAYAAHGSVANKLEAGTLAPLTAADRVPGRVRISGVPLIDNRAETLILEQFDVMAPGAKIRFHREDGKVVNLEPTPMRQFQGHVEGEPESLVYLSVARGKVEGFIAVRERKFLVTSRGRRADARQVDGVVGDVIVEEVAASEEFAIGHGKFECGVEGDHLRPLAEMVPQSLAVDARPKSLPVTNAAPTGTQLTMLNLVLQTDSKLYENFGDDEVAVETFVRNLAGAASTIYQRDLVTMLRIVDLDVFSDTDPWNVVLGQNSTWDGVGVTFGALHAMLEYGDYWHNTPPTSVQKSAAMLISGMFVQVGNSYSFEGIAWTNILCTNEALNTAGQGYPFPYVNHYRGPYGFCGGNGIPAFPDDQEVPDPDANPNFAAPADGYWPLLQFAHELGHIVQSPHTHCIDTDAGTGGLQPVDTCFNGESGCFGGAPSLPAVKGTIMSYCHYTFGGANSRFTFGQPAELSNIVLTNMKTRLGVKTPALSAITGPSTMNVGAADSAFVTNVAGMTYDWTITNGVINSGQGTNSINFTATTDPVLLRVTATNTLGCAITDSKNVAVEEASFDPPTNVVATAVTSNSVQITWDAVPGATNYKVYRAQQQGSFGTLVGSTGLTNLTDNTAAANTAYQYVVTAGDGGAGESTFSDDDLAVTVIYTDPTLTALSTKAKLVHFTELLTAVNAINTLIGSSTIGFTAPTPTTSVTVRRQHLLDLRTALDTARGVLGFPALTYTDPAITATSTKIKAAHINELRNGMQ